MTRITIIKCDICEMNIDEPERRMDASVYGVDCHIECFKTISPGGVLLLLSIDDINLGDNYKTTKSGLQKYGLV